VNTRYRKKRRRKNGPQRSGDQIPKIIKFIRNIVIFAALFLIRQAFSCIYGRNFVGYYNYNKRSRLMGKKILVVDDDGAVRLSLAVALRTKGGFEVVEAEDGAKGLELAKHHHPDLIISDVIMENLNGFLMLETLKDFPETADIPVILMTHEAQTDRDWKTGAAVEYLAKGFTLDALLAKVNAILKIKPST
jgi:two-component system chemotaxis response regulator CheY